MSAIWGIISEKTNIEECSKMMDAAMEPFLIDRKDTLDIDRAHFACGHQFFTNESLTDRSPCFDKERGILFTADCFLTNRKEIVDELAGADASVGDSYAKMGDANLAYEMFLKYGEKFVTHLTGSFALAVYEINKNILMLYADHVAQRYLAYTISDNYVCFGSVFQPIIAAIGKGNINLNEEWIAAAYTDCTADTIKIPEITVYDNIYQVPAGKYVKINLSTGSKELIEYWNPTKTVKMLNLSSDEEYRKLFVDTFEDTVKRMMRARGEVGVQLSGGLDSSTVAAFLARNLATEGKTLYSYTSVPADGYKYVNNYLTVENESDYIYAQQKMYPNISPRFIDADGKNAFEGQMEYNRFFCEPVKPILNMNLSCAMAEAAKQDGCSLLFSGQNGNATISYGRILTYTYRKLLSFEWSDAIKEIKAFCRRFRTPGKKFVKVFLNTFKEEKLFPEYMGDSNLIRDDLVRKYGLKKLNKHIFTSRGTGSMDSSKQRRNFCFMPEVFQHMGYYDTYFSLQYGYLPLDPTLSKAMIELTMAMPIDCFVKNGKERRAVRDYMKGYVCDEILDNHTARGAQAADYTFRVQRDWANIRDKVFDMLDEPMLRDYFDDAKLKELAASMKACEGELDGSDVAKAAVISSLSCFLRSLK